MRHQPDRKYELRDHVGAFGERTRKKAPPAVTHAEAFYYLKQLESQTPLVFRLRDGEEIRGVLDWYDRDCFRVNLEEGGHVVLRKAAIAYLHKAPSSPEPSPPASDGDAEPDPA
ncbi:MAG: hypothetical protein AAF533_03330 [Acidobacteriota bacterium]